MDNSNVPALRFAEFSQCWEKKKLKEICSINQGLQIPIADRFLKKVSDSYFYITNEFLKGTSGKAYYIKNPSKSVVCTEDDILMTRTGNTGQVVTNVNGAFHNNFFKIKYSSDVLKDFYVYFLRSVKIQNQILKLAGSSTIPDLNHGDFYRIEINLPDIKEQKKIANFLSAVDSKIEQLGKKKALLEQYKKGVASTLLSTRMPFDKAQGKRFKQDNGEDCPEWEVKRLGDVAKYYDGTHQTPKYVEKGIPFYSVEHVTANQFTTTKYISNDVFEKENKRVKLEKGDILMTRIGSIGVAKYIDWDVNASFYVSLALIKNNDSFNSKFLNHLINSIGFQKELWRRTIHVAFPKKINLGEIGNCILKMPCIEEQQKIANFLSSLDKKIEATQKQIEQTEAFKKGLLQKMFV